MSSADVLDESRRCQSCGSPHTTPFLGEMCLRSHEGLEGSEKPPIWVFPQVVVCLACGFAQFAVPDAELRLIQQSVERLG